MCDMGRDKLSCAGDRFYRKSRWLPRAVKCFSDSIMGGSVSCEGVVGLVPILPTAANSQHHPRVYQAEHLNIFTSLIEIRRWRGREENSCSCAFDEYLTFCLYPHRGSCDISGLGDTVTEPGFYTGSEKVTSEMCQPKQTKGTAGIPAHSPFLPCPSLESMYIVVTMQSTSWSWSKSAPGSHSCQHHLCRLSH